MRPRREKGRAGSWLPSKLRCWRVERCTTEAGSSVRWLYDRFRSSIAGSEKNLGVKLVVCSELLKRLHYTDDICECREVSKLGQHRHSQVTLT